MPGAGDASVHGGCASGSASAVCTYLTPHEAAHDLLCALSTAAFQAEAADPLGLPVQLLEWQRARIRPCCSLRLAGAPGPPRRGVRQPARPARAPRAAPYQRGPRQHGCQPGQLALARFADQPAVRRPHPVSPAATPPGVPHDASTPIACPQPFEGASTSHAPALLRERACHQRFFV